MSRPGSTIKIIDVRNHGTTTRLFYRILPVLVTLPAALVILLGYLLNWYTFSVAGVLLHAGLVLFIYGLIWYGKKWLIKQDRFGEESIRQFELLLDSAPDATLIVDEQGLISRVNRQVENLFGYSKSELLGQPVEILIPSELHSRHIGHRDAYRHQPKFRSMGSGMELKAVKKDKNYFPVEISLAPIYINKSLFISASIRDITDRKKAEAKFKALLDSAPDATVIVNRNGAIEMVNRQAENLFGYSRDELTGKPVEMLIPADLHTLHRKHREQYNASPKVRSMGEGLELHAVKKGGATFAVEISISPIQTEEGMLVAASIRDISARKKLEKELKKSHADIEAFTYSVSHDLRAPLRGIIGFTTILEEDYGQLLDNEGNKVIGVIRHNALRMGKLIDDLLTFSHMDREQISRGNVDMRNLLDEVISESVLNYPAPVNWIIREICPARADINLIRQVWVNLISNALKYSSTKPSPEIIITGKEEDGHLVYSVRDNGVGFDETYKHKLFKVFQRLHDAEEFEGTGIGLALVGRIIEKHEGRVWAEGQTGKGACFYFSLPKTPGHAQ